MLKPLSPPASDPLLRVLFIIGAALLPWIHSSGCDSTWFAAREQRRHDAESASGAEVSGGEEDGSRPVRYVGRVRIYASADYRRQHRDWTSKVDSWIERASTVLGPSVSLRLELAETRAWEPECDPADLGACLAELRNADDGEGVDWVFGLLGAQPRFTESFDMLGVAEHPGRYAILRDIHDVHERAAIDSAFSEMREERRTEIYRRRQRHKRLVLFLHELGHTLGAVHTRNQETVLYPSYSDDVASFSDGNVALMEAALVDHFAPDPSYASLRDAASSLESIDWASGERDALLRRLAGLASRRPPPSPGGGSALPRVTVSEEGGVLHPFLIPGRTDELLSEVPPEHRAHYDSAVRELVASEYWAAWAELRPLVDLHPTNYAVQSFGCSLAMHLGQGGYIGPACDRTIQLASTQPE